MTGNELCAAIADLGYDFFTGVPDSTLAGALKVLETDLQYQYVVSVREDNAVGLAVGAYLGGRKSAVFMQSSGLGHCMDALTSLACLYKIPVLLVVGWRGQEATDAPEHRVLGKALPALLQAIGISFWVPHRGEIEASLRAASLWSISQNMPSAVLIRRGLIQ